MLWEYKIKEWMMVVVVITDEQAISYRRDNRLLNLIGLQDRFNLKVHFSSNSNTHSHSLLVLDNQEEDLILDNSVVVKIMQLLLFHLECHNSTNHSYQCSIHPHLLSLYPILLFLALKLRHLSHWRRSLRWLKSKMKSWVVSCRS